MRKKPETVDNTINQGVISIVSFLKKMSDDNDFLKTSVEEFRNSDNQVISLIESINTNLDKYFGNKVGLSNKAKNDISNQDLIKKLTSIESVIQNIYTEIKKKSKKDTYQTTEQKINTSNIEALTGSLSSLASTVSRKTNISLRRFIKLVNTLTSPEMAAQVSVASASFADLAKQLSTIGNGLEKADQHMKKFMKGLIVFSLFLLSPTFAKGTAALTKLMDAMIKPKTKTINKEATQWKWIFMTFALGITALVLALMNLEKIDWGRAGLLVVFLFAVAGAMFLATRNMKNLTSVKGSSKVKQKFSLNSGNSLALEMLFLSAGLAVLILAIDAIKDVNWAEAGKLVLFLLAIQTIMVVSDIIVGRKGSGTKGGLGMLGFSVGLAILILAIDASRDLFTDSIVTNGSWDVTKWKISPVWGIVAFIAFMTIMLGLSGIGKGTGGVASHMVKFALGMGILILAIWAGSLLFKDSIKTHGTWDVTKWEISPVWGAVAFVALMTMVLGMSGIGKGSGGVAAHMLKFSFGLLVMVGAIYVMIKVMTAKGIGVTLGAVGILTGTILALAGTVKLATILLKGVRRKQFMEDLTMIATVGAVGIALFTAIALVESLGASNEKILGAVLIISIMMFAMAFGISALANFIEKQKLTPAKLKKSEKLLMVSIGIFALGVVAYSLIALAQSMFTADNTKILAATQIIFLVLIEVVLMIWGLTVVMKGVKETELAKAYVILGVAVLIVTAASLVYTLLAVATENADNTKILVATQIMVLCIVEVLALATIIGAVASTGIGAIIMGVGIALMAALSTSILIAASALYIISITDISEEKITNFTESVGKIFMMYTSFSIADMIAMVATAVVSLPVVMSSFIMAGVVALISAVDISPKKIDNFSEGIFKIFKTYTKFGLRDMLKMAGSAAASLPIALSALAMSETLKNLTEVNVPQDKIDHFTKMVVDFVKKFAETMEETSSEALEKMEDSGEALKAITDMAKNFVDVLIKIQGGQIAVYGIDEKTGESKIVDYEKFDFDKISTEAGNKLGKLMGDFAKTYADYMENVGRKQINRAKTASEALGNLAPIFDSITNLVGDAERVKVLTDTTSVSAMAANVNSFVSQTVDAMKSLAGINFTAGRGVDTFKDFASAMSTWASINWPDTISNTDKFSTSIDKVVKNINGLDLKKAIQMKNVIDSFNKMGTMEKLQNQIKEMTEMLKEINKYNENINNSAIELLETNRNTNANQQNTNNLVKNLGDNAVTAKDLHNIVSQIVTSMVNEILSGISTNTYDVNVKNKVKVETKNY